MESVDETGLGSHGFSNENVPFSVVYLFIEVSDRKKERKRKQERKRTEESMYIFEASSVRARVDAPCKL